MFADASWPAHGMFLGHLSLSLCLCFRSLVSSFRHSIPSTCTPYARGLITRAHTCTVRIALAIINEVTEIPTVIFAFQSVIDIHTYIQCIARLYCRIRCLALRRSAIIGKTSYTLTLLVRASLHVFTHCIVILVQHKI